MEQGGTLSASRTTTFTIAPSNIFCRAASLFWSSISISTVELFFIPRVSYRLRSAYTNPSSILVSGHSCQRIPFDTSDIATQTHSASRPRILRRRSRFISLLLCMKIPFSWCAPNQSRFKYRTFLLEFRGPRLARKIAFVEDP